jgi:two-component system CheB/CheR fusion protein
MTAEEKALPPQETPQPGGPPDEPAPAEPGSFPIVGLGASAGGLEALETFFTHMPPDSGLAFVVIQHLDPSHKSMLPALIQRYTQMPLKKVEDGLAVEPNCVYIIPPTGPTNHSGHEIAD